MAKATGVSEAKATDIVVASGIGGDMYVEIDSVFAPVLKKDMPLDQRKQVVRETMKQAMAVDDRLNLVSGELLYEVSKNGYWKEWVFEESESGEMRSFTSFDEYCEVELEMKRRKAYYLIKIYDTFVVKLGLPTDILRELEWSKAKEVVDVINSENWLDLLDSVKDMTVKQVQSMVAEMKGITKGTKADGEVTTTVKMAFNFHPEQAENVQNALAIATTMTASEKPANNLDLICSDFVAGAAGMGLEGALGKLDIIISNVERAFAVKLSIVEVDSGRLEKLDDAKAKAEKVKRTKTTKP